MHTAFNGNVIMSSTFRDRVAHPTRPVFRLAFPDSFPGRYGRREREERQLDTSR